MHTYLPCKHMEEGVASYHIQAHDLFAKLTLLLAGYLLFVGWVNIYLSWKVGAVESRQSHSGSDGICM